MSDGSVACWGVRYNMYYMYYPDEWRGLSADSVSVGVWHTCGVVSGGSVACWGNNEVGQAAPPGGPGP